MPGVVGVVGVRAGKLDRTVKSLPRAGIRRNLAAARLVDEGMLETAIRVNKLTSIEMVTFYTKAGGSCATCVEGIETVLARTNAAMVADGVIAAEAAFVPGTSESGSGVKRKPQMAKAPAVALSDDFVPLDIFNEELRMAPPRPKLTMVQKLKLVEEAIAEMRPTLKRDGGDCELIDIEDDKVMVRMTGACANCQLSALTVAGIQEKLAAKTSLALKVIPVAGPQRH